MCNKNGLELAGVMIVVLSLFALFLGCFLPYITTMKDRCPGYKWNLDSRIVDGVVFNTTVYNLTYKAICTRCSGCGYCDYPCHTSIIKINYNVSELDYKYMFNMHICNIDYNKVVNETYEKYNINTSISLRYNPDNPVSVTRNLEEDDCMYVVNLIFLGIKIIISINVIYFTAMNLLWNYIPN